MSNPTPTNSPLPTTDETASTVAQDVDKALNIGETLVDNAIIAADPAVMNFPVWKQIWQKFIHWIFTQLASVMGTGSGFIVIDIQKYNALMNAAEVLQQLNAAKSSGNLEAINAANSAINAAVAPILHYIGSVEL